jgi:ABC-type Mn2+/Zn2+ transport system ATPase subunit
VCRAEASRMPKDAFSLQESQVRDILKQVRICSCKDSSIQNFSLSTAQRLRIAISTRN